MNDCVYTTWIKLADPDISNENDIVSYRRKSSLNSKLENTWQYKLMKKSQMYSREAGRRMPFVARLIAVILKPPNPSPACHVSQLEVVSIIQLPVRLQNLHIKTIAFVLLHKSPANWRVTATWDCSCRWNYIMYYCTELTQSRSEQSKQHDSHLKSKTVGREIIAKDSPQRELVVFLYLT